MPTPIEWADETFNPWWGCERVSPACAHCYADTFAKRLGMSALWPRNIHGDIHGFRFFGDKHWDEPLKWAARLPAKLGRRPRVFCASMADVFEDRPELEQPRRRLFKLIVETEELDRLILTKRPEFARDWMRRWYERYWSDVDVGARQTAMPWTSRDRAHWGVHPNIWLGVSIENARYTWRADVLREIPAAVRFISAEPLLGSLFPKLGAGVTESPSLETGSRPDAHPRRGPLDLSGIDWVIIGGESGPGARPFHLEHAREILAACACPTCHGSSSWADHEDECYRDGDCSCSGVEVQCDDCTNGYWVAPFVKQLGARPVVHRARVAAEAGTYRADLDAIEIRLRDRKGGDMDEWPADLRIREFPRTAVPA